LAVGLLSTGANRKQIRLHLIALAILGVIFATTLSAVWHTLEHTSEATCVICHLNHQPINNALSFHPELPDFAPVGTQPQAKEALLAQSPLIARIPARAPPTA
jgi:Na+/phosphate symporter